MSDFFDFIYRMGVFATTWQMLHIIYERSKQNWIDPKNKHQVKHVKYIPLQMCGLAHALCTSLFGVLYVAGMVRDHYIFDIRMGSTAFLVFDVYQHWRSDTEKNHLNVFIKERGLQSLLGQQGAGMLWHNLYILTFHHVCTIGLMFGLFFKSEIAGCVMFFVGEIPIIFINIVRLQAYKGLQDSPLFGISTLLSTVTYFALRVLMFPLVFCVTMLPTMSVFNPLAWCFCVCLFGAFILNLISFQQLIQANKQDFPFSLQSVVGCVQLILEKIYTPRPNTIHSKHQVHEEF